MKGLIQSRLRITLHEGVNTAQAKDNLHEGVNTAQAKDNPS